MNTNYEAKIRYEKRLKRNIYNVDDIKFRIIWWIFIALMAASLVDCALMKLSVLWRVIIFTLISLAIFFPFYILTGTNKTEIMPYKRITTVTNKGSFNFIGLHNLEKESLDDKSNSDVLSREIEVKHLENVLEYLVFPQSEIKQAICVTGKSGCGKSSILAFFEKKNLDYKIINFSGSYLSFKSRLEEEFGYDIDSKIKEVSENRKIVFILDQFERYFFLPRSKQNDLRMFISSLCHRNIGIIFSLREEYLAEFLREYDLDDIKSNVQTSDKIVHKGVLRSLIGIIRETDNYVFFNGSRRKISVEKWKDEHIKKPDFLHISSPDDSKIKTDKIGKTVFYCENQNDLMVTCNDNKGRSTVIYDKCGNAFPNFQDAFFLKYSENPLIEQQIIFHMAEFENKINDDEERVRSFSVMEKQEILKYYFDIQLCSTEDFFNASRIMYLLSSARIRQISMKEKELATGLFCNQFNASGNKVLKKTLEKLENLQLIRRNSSDEFEISHDYIAKEFIKYSGANLERNVKEALDVYISDFINESETERKNEVFAKKSGINSFCRKLCETIEEHDSDNFFKLRAVICIILVLITDIVYRFIWNPWEEVVLNNPTHGQVPVFLPINLAISTFYIYKICDLILKYYNGKRKIMLRINYIIMCIGAVLSEVFYPHFLIPEGLVIMLLGATAAFLLDRKYRESSRLAMFGYGIKCFVVGGAFAFVHFIFIIFQKNLPLYLYVLEALVITILIGYGHLTHLTKEYMYARRMDVSGKVSD